MAATVIVNEWNGTVGLQIATSKAGGTIKFKSADNSEMDDVNPLVKPNAGVYRSAEKWIRAYISDLGGSVNISNIEIFTTGTPNTGVSIWATAVDTYCDAAGDPEASPSRPRLGGRTMAGALPQPKSNLFASKSDDALSLGVGPFMANGDDGDILSAGVGKYLVLQMEVLPSAAIGATRSYHMVLRYDEE